METTKKCHRCAQCCYYISPKTKKLKECKYLIKFRGNGPRAGKGKCKKYLKRRALWNIGVPLVIEKDDKGRPLVVCVPRKFQLYDYPGCPYNNKKRVYAPWLQKRISIEVKWIEKQQKK